MSEKQKENGKVHLKGQLRLYMQWPAVMALLLEYLDLPDRSSRWIPDVRICPDLYYDGGHSVSV